MGSLLCVLRRGTRGEGLRHRNGSKPHYHGLSCSGDNVTTCKQRDCPDRSNACILVTCEISANCFCNRLSDITLRVYVVDDNWSNWTTCSKSCDSGIETRTCTNPRPQYVGGTVRARVCSRFGRRVRAPLGCVVILLHAVPLSFLFHSRYMCMLGECVRVV